MKRFSVFAWPAYANKAANPYNYILYKAVEKQGIPVSEFNFRPANLLKFCFATDHKIFHIHWPSDIIANPDKKKALVKLNIFFAFIRIFKIFKKKIVWTVHNFHPHETYHPELQDKLDEFLFNQVDGFISLNSAGVIQIKNRLSGKQQKLAYIPHMHYSGYYTNETNRQSAQKKLGLSISSDCFVFLFIGQIRTYKNVTGLIKAFKAVNDANTLLLIAGKASKDLEAEMLTEIAGAANIKLFNEFVKDDEIQLFMNSADLTVIPFNKVFNSGSAFLNISFGTPILVPEFGTFTEIQKEIGNDLVKIYKGSIDARQLKTAMSEIKITAKTNHIKIKKYDPDEIALQTIDFYTSLINR